MIIEIDDRTVLVGTAHVSAKSVAAVEETLRERRPDQVLIELDPRRAEALKDPEAWKQTDLIQIIRQKKQHMFLLQLYLANMQARMGETTGVRPGGEMIRAMEVAEEIGAEVVLIDRDIAVTLRRGFGSMSLWQRMALGFNIMLETLPEPPEEEAKAARPPSALATALPFLVLASLLVPTLGTRVLDGAHGVFDTLIGISSIPALTVLLTTATFAALGVALASASGTARRVGPLHALAPVGWVALVGGLLATWSWRTTDGLSLAYQQAMWPGSPAPAVLVILTSLLVLATAAAVFLAAKAFQDFEAHRRAARDGRPTDIDAMLESDTITQMTEEFAQFAPVVKTALIDERDAYMASHVRERMGKGSLVAIVGAGHLPGMQRHILQPDEAPSREELDKDPPKRIGLAKIVGYGVPALVIGVFVYLALAGEFQALLDLAVAWVLVNGALSALGAAIALGHPLSILTAFVAAPITSLNPALAAGWFAGLVEAKVRTPKVADFEAIKTVETLRAFWTNGVVRVVLVTALANLGSVAGTWVALGLGLKEFAGA